MVTMGLYVAGLLSTRQAETELRWRKSSAVAD